MESHLHEFEYSKYFNYLFFIATWSYNTKNLFRQRVYMTYRMILFLGFFVAVTLQITDLWLALGDVPKMTYNMCTSTVVIGATTKYVLLLRKTHYLDDLRRRLWHDYYKYDDPEYIVVKEKARAEMKLLAKMFHVALIGFYPICMFFGYFSYYRKARELPFPAYFPFNFEESRIGFDGAFILEFLFGILILAVTIESDLIVFSLVLQMSVQFKILYTEILKVNDLYKEDELIDDIALKKYQRYHNTEKSFKIIVKRQVILSKYGKLFENGFNQAFLIQMFAGTVLLTMNGLQFIKMTLSFNHRLIYEFLFLVAILTDLFFNCLYATILKEQCTSLGDAAYSCAWYRMDANLQKYTLMVIIQAQGAPKITAGKFIVVNLNSFLLLLRNTYSWLMLFRQIELK